MDEAIDRKRGRFKPNRDVAKGHRIAVGDLVQSANPAELGTRKRGQLRRLYRYSIMKSFRLLYTDCRKGEIRLVDLDDHKNLYGRD